MNLAIQRYRLSDEPQRFGLSCTTRGLTLAGVPLLKRSETGFSPRPAQQIHRLIGQAYSGTVDAAHVMTGLNAVSRALNEGEVAQAMIRAVLLKLPELDWEGAVRLAQTENILSKAGFDPDELRDSRGRWTTNEAVGSSPANDHLRAPGRADIFLNTFQMRMMTRISWMLRGTVSFTTKSGMRWLII